ncbi:hypothetical protein ACFV04_05060, partial [Kitasatospora sp. NPDC059599]
MPVVVAVGLLTCSLTGWFGAPGTADGVAWEAVYWAVCAAVVLSLGLTGLVRHSQAEAVPPATPVVTLHNAEAPELYRLIDELAGRLDVPAPSAIALTPDCDSWLEEHDRPEGAAPVLVIGSPFLWWMRAGELRALLAPVVAGSAASADPEIAAARRFVRSLNAAVAVGHRGPLAVADRITRRLLGACRGHSAELERSVAAWASEQARTVDYGLRIAAQEQVGLAYAGWDRLL